MEDQPKPNPNPKPKPKECGICRATISPGHLSRHTRSAACRRAKSKIAESFVSYEDEITDVMNNIQTISHGIGEMVHSLNYMKKILKLSIIFPSQTTNMGKKHFLSNQRRLK